MVRTIKIFIAGMLIGGASTALTHDDFLDHILQITESTNFGYGRGMQAGFIVGMTQAGRDIDFVCAAARSQNTSFNRPVEHLDETSRTAIDIATRNSTSKTFSDLGIQCDLHWDSP